jgi:hypothetical protein
VILRDIDHLPSPTGMTSTALDLSASVGISFSMSLPSLDSSGSLLGGGGEEEIESEKMIRQREIKRGREES